MNKKIVPLFITLSLFTLQPQIHAAQPNPSKQATPNILPYLLIEAAAIVGGTTACVIGYRQKAHCNKKVDLLQKIEDYCKRKRINPNDLSSDEIFFFAQKLHQEETLKEIINNHETQETLTSKAFWNNILLWGGGATASIGLFGLIITLLKKRKIQGPPDEPKQKQKKTKQTPVAQENKKPQPVVKQPKKPDDDDEITKKTNAELQKLDDMLQQENADAKRRDLQLLQEEEERKRQRDAQKREQKRQKRLATIATNEKRLQGLDNFLIANEQKLAMAKQEYAAALKELQSFSDTPAFIKNLKAQNLSGQQMAAKIKGLPREYQRASSKVVDLLRQVNALHTRHMTITRQSKSVKSDIQTQRKHLHYYR